MNKKFLLVIPIFVLIYIAINTIYYINIKNKISENVNNNFQIKNIKYEYSYDLFQIFKPIILKNIFLEKEITIEKIIIKLKKEDFNIEIKNLNLKNFKYETFKNIVYAKSFIMFNKKEQEIIKNNLETPYNLNIETFNNKENININIQNELLYLDTTINSSNLKNILKEKNENLILNKIVLIFEIKLNLNNLMNSFYQKVFLDRKYKDYNEKENGLKEIKNSYINFIKNYILSLENIIGKKYSKIIEEKLLYIIENNNLYIELYMENTNNKSIKEFFDLIDKDFILGDRKYQMNIIEENINLY